MSVLIKGMKMPKGCTDCPFKGFDRNGRGNVCIIDKSIDLHACLYGLDVKFVAMGDCPLIELPDHGDLIDRDALMEILADWQYTEAPQEGSNWRIDKMVTSHEAQYEKYLLLKQVYDEVKDFPVMIIPEERSEDPSHPFADSVMMGERSEDETD